MLIRITSQIKMRFYLLGILAGLALSQNGGTNPEPSILLNQFGQPYYIDANGQVVYASRSMMMAFQKNVGQSIQNAEAPTQMTQLVEPVVVELSALQAEVNEPVVSTVGDETNTVGDETNTVGDETNRVEQVSEVAQNNQTLTINGIFEIKDFNERSVAPDSGVNGVQAESPETLRVADIFPEGSESSSTVTTTRVESNALQLLNFQLIDQYILNLNTSAISSIVSALISDPALTCNQKAAYLSTILAHLQNALRDKSYTAAKIVNADLFYAQIQRIQKQIEGIQGNISSLALPEIQQSMNQTLKELENGYKTYNTFMLQIQKKESELNSLQNELILQQMQMESKADTENINGVEGNTPNVQNSLTADISRRLKELNKIRDDLLKSIASEENKLKQNEMKIQTARSNIESTEEYIRQLRYKTYDIKSMMITPELQISRIRRQLESAQGKPEPERSQIAEVTRLKAQLQYQIDTLQKSYFYVGSQIISSYYRCTGGILTWEEDHYVVIFEGDMFDYYLQKYYDVFVEAPTPTQIKLQRVQVYGTQWEQAFPYPYPLVNNFEAQDYVNNKASCNVSKSSIKGIGRIYLIRANYIGVELQDGKQVPFVLGLCSRIESVSSLPSVGQSIAYIVDEIEKDIFMLRQGSSF